VIELCTFYDATTTDYEKVLLIEETVYPDLAEEYRKKVEEKVKSGRHKNVNNY
jgi:hypothetical protein